MYRVEVDVVRLHPSHDREYLPPEICERTGAGTELPGPLDLE